MSRIILLVLLVAACGRRETISGNWSGVAVPDGGTGTAVPVQDESTPTRGAIDASSSKAADPEVGPPLSGPTLLPPDAAAPGGSTGAEVLPPGAQDPGFAARDADLGDARPCPDAARCD